MKRKIRKFLDIDYNNYKSLDEQSKLEVCNYIFVHIINAAIRYNEKFKNYITPLDIYLDIKETALDEEYYELLEIFKDFERFYTEKLNEYR